MTEVTVIYVLLIWLIRYAEMAKALKKKLKLKLICFNPFIKIPSDLVVKNLPANAGDAGDVGSIPGLGRSPGEENGSPFQYSGLENPRDRGAWRAIVHGAAKSRTRLSD